jgi:hypothetical protein
VLEQVCKGCDLERNPAAPKKRCHACGEDKPYRAFASSKAQKCKECAEKKAREPTHCKRCGQTKPRSDFCHGANEYQALDHCDACKNHKQCDVQKSQAWRDPDPEAWRDSGRQKLIQWMNPSVTGARYEVGQQRRGMDVFVGRARSRIATFTTTTTVITTTTKEAAALRMRTTFKGLLRGYVRVVTQDLDRHHGETRSPHAWRNWIRFTTRARSFTVHQ